MVRGGSACEWDVIGFHVWWFKRCCRKSWLHTASHSAKRSGDLPHGPPDPPHQHGPRNPNGCGPLIRAKLVNRTEGTCKLSMEGVAVGSKIGHRLILCAVSGGECCKMFQQEVAKINMAVSAIICAWYKRYLAKMKQRGRVKHVAL